MAFIFFLKLMAVNSWGNGPANINVKVKKMPLGKKSRIVALAKKLKKKSNNRNNNNAESPENNEDLESQSSLLFEKREKLARRSRIFAASQKDVDEVGMYRLECSRQDCLPISRYIRNIHMAAFEMGYANIGPEEFLPLSLSLGRNTSVIKLDLRHNWLGDDVRLLNVIMRCVCVGSLLSKSSTI